MTGRKLVPALYNLSCQELLPPGFAVIGFSLTPMTDASFRAQMEQRVKHSPDVLAFRQKLWDEFVPALHYITARFDGPEGYLQLDAREGQPAGSPCPMSSTTPARRIVGMRPLVRISCSSPAACGFR